MVTYIRQLLFGHDCVVIPGLGAFIANYQPARVRLQESRIFPPSKSIAFNRSLRQNDGLLVSLVSRSEGISYKEAEEKVQQFVQSCQSGLSKHRSYIFQDIGRLFYDQDENLLFEPADTLNFLVDANSLPALELAPVERLRSGSSLEDSRPKIENDRDVEALLEALAAEAPVRRTAKAPYWVAFTLVIAFLSAITGISLNRGDFSGTSFATIFPDLSIPTVHTPVQHTPVIAEQPEAFVPVAEPAPITPELTVETVTEPVVSTTTPVTTVTTVPEVPKAYIVVGAFFGQSLADKARQEAEQHGFRTVQLDEYDGTLHRIMIVSDIQRIEADLADVKSRLNARAWVYCRNCTY